MTTSTIDTSKFITSKDVLSYFESLADTQNSLPVSSAEFATYLDSIDQFASCRNLFNLPVDSNSAQLVYLCGNSLGLQPKKTVEYVMEELKKWGDEGVEGHFRGSRPWVCIDEPCLPLAAQIVGAAHSSEIAICNSLSANLHLLLTSFYRPTDTRFKVIIEAAAFCSDHHIIRSQISLHNLKIEDTLIQLTPKRGENYLLTEDIITAIHSAGDSLALVLLPGVQFYTGQAFNITEITAAGHKVGAYVGWDLAHAVGNINLTLHDSNVDFAAWCSYKYLNSGPGAIGGLFLHQNHAKKDNKELPKLSGWWGQKQNDRFLMLSDHLTIEGAQAYQLSNPPVLQTVCVQSSLELFKSVGGVSALRSGLVTVLTPTNIIERGCQLSLLFDIPIRGLLKLLEPEGVIADGREPNVIRLSPTPLYNSYMDVWLAVNKLEKALTFEKKRIRELASQPSDANSNPDVISNGY